MLGPNVMMVEAARLIHRQLDDFLGAGGEPDFTEHNAVTAPDDEFDGAADLIQFDAKVAQNFRGYSITLAYET